MSTTATSATERRSDAWQPAARRALRPVSLRGPVVIAVVALVLLALVNRPAAAATANLAACLFNTSTDTNTGTGAAPVSPN